MSIQCRTCAAKIFNPIAKNLFEDDDKILKNIEILTGMRLKEDQNMPKHICTCCHLDLCYSMAFRDRCLRAENILRSGKANVTLRSTLNTTTVNSKLIKSLRKISPTISYPAKALPVSNDDTDSNSTENLKSFGRMTTDYSEESCSISSDELSNWSGDEVTSTSSDSEFEEPLPTLSEMKKLIKDSDEEVTSTLSETGHDECLTSPSPIEKAIDNIDDASPKPTEEPLPKEQEELPNQKMDDAKQMPVEGPLPEQQKKSTNNETNGNKKRRAEPANPRILICDQCGYQTSCKRSLNIHILRHKGEKNFVCKECGARHYSQHLLQLHVRVRHKGEMPFVCKYCNQRFFTSSAKLRHEVVRHIRDFKYECKICNKKYLTKSCLTKHEFLHTGQKPYRCELCNVGFPRRPGLRIHCRTKQHQKRESEALISQLNVVNEITIPAGSIVFPGSIIEEYIDV
ncbi:zinc finger and SCAN domain-containing protein 31-like [Drosophila innubila]|uniref:zinc finger and SCAN domain-containing protein 31-like n=1 Tax=Drosophila innubila TaxID=198719 RepID=UPI00148CDCD1|nr:zinc finger and SCAN domain-containing protein 31-like [Drosophila innubila]